MNENFDVIVIGSGHAGSEACYASARMGKKTLLLTLNLDSIGFLACNPSIGGTAKGQLVGEISALGGAMGRVADETKLQMRLLNAGKGPAVQSMRAQVDKNKYHEKMKQLLENTPNLTIVQSEVTDFIVENGEIKGVTTALGKTYYAKAVIVATGVYLQSVTTTGHHQQKSGPNGFMRSEHLSQAIEKAGHKLYRFKTGTPARINADSVDFGVLEEQASDSSRKFSCYTSTKFDRPCYLAYTNANTHKIILDNINDAPVFSGEILGVGPRYCPSIETKILRFKDKERHQIFLEPESLSTKEIYVQGMSTSFSADMQDKIYHSIKGLENCQIMRYAYAIEYDCIDPTTIRHSLMSRFTKGLFFAGQVNGTSGYEEAGAQGIMAGINAALYLDGKPRFVLKRNEAYIGVLIDDLITKGVDEPYRMMTSRAEYRLILRQDNCDLRLTDYGIKYGLVDARQKRAFKNKLKQLSTARTELSKIFPPKLANEYLRSIGEKEVVTGISLKDIIKRTKADVFSCKEFLGVFDGIKADVLEIVNTEVKYEGYIKMQMEMIDEMLANENTLLPADLDYSDVKGLRLEAREKLSRQTPSNLGIASRISGVSPADISVLLVYLKQHNLI